LGEFYSIKTYWSTCGGLEGYSTPDHLHTILVIKAHDIRFTAKEICRRKYDEILTAGPRLTTTPAELRVCVEEAAKEHHKDLFAADLVVSQEELKKGNVVYSPLIGAVLFESLQIAPKAFLGCFVWTGSPSRRGSVEPLAPRRHPTRLLDYPVQRGVSPWLWSRSDRAVSLGGCLSLCSYRRRRAAVQPLWRTLQPVSRCNKVSKTRRQSLECRTH
jgi:hypothetical protein